MNKYVTILTLLLSSQFSHAEVVNPLLDTETRHVSDTKCVAITIDDLPFVGTGSDSRALDRTQKRFLKLVQHLVDNKVPATGFVIANSIGKGQWQLLEEFRNDGFSIGNHTYSHANLNRMSTESYIREIARADEILAPIMTQPKYFRYPYLAEGRNDERKQAILDYLAAQKYTVAPVTIDSKDYLFNERLLRIHWREREHYLSHIKNDYLNFIWQQTMRAENSKHNPYKKQILLLHANLLNSYVLGDIIALYRDHDYCFVSLQEALESNSQESKTVVELNPVDSNNIPHD
jgi:peptidoglycan-N-acetylglucosamine deacetylase